MIPYTPLPTAEEYYRQNGDRHLERAIAYISAGYPLRFYNGSMLKAIKNFKKADSVKIPKFLLPMLDGLAKAIADKIMNGS